MNTEIHIDNLKATDKEAIGKIANWYFDEWKTPIEKTFRRLENQTSEEVLFQLIAHQGARVVGTAGLANKVNLITVHERFSHLKPWVALLYTHREFRRQGVGKLLLQEIEQQAKEKGLSEIYLYTFTAEKLYSECGWKEIDRVHYKEHDTVVMRKEILTNQIGAV